MTEEQLEKGKLLQSQINIVDGYIKAFDPAKYCVNLQVVDLHGNQGPVLKLYGYTKEENEAIGYKMNLDKGFGEFLKESVKKLQVRKEELEKELQNL